MADDKSIELRATLKSLFPDSWLREAARESGFVKRERKICPVAFFWTIAPWGSASTRAMGRRATPAVRSRLLPIPALQLHLGCFRHQVLETRG